MSKRIRSNRISITLSEPYLNGIEELMKTGIYRLPSDVIRDALKLLFEKRGIEPF